MIIPFEYTPTVTFLAQLVHPQNLNQSKVLSKAVRLWVILRSIYGCEGDSVLCDVGDEFTYSDWLDSFFQDRPTFHRHRDRNSYDHQNEHCHCRKTLEDWLFKGDCSTDYQPWVEAFNSLFNPTKPELTAHYLETLSWEEDSQKQSAKARIFACVGRTLKNHFDDLVKMGYLDDLGIKDSKDKKQEQHYARVDNVHELFIKDSLKNNNHQEIDFIPYYIVHEDFSEIPGIFHEKIEGVRRFFMHVDYAVSPKEIKREWPQYFKSLWEANQTPIIELNYSSVSLHRDVKRIVYPVCIYYYQRAIYLCAYGQVPKKRSEINWYNYRLDRIQSVKELQVEDDKIPQEIAQAIAVAKEAFTGNQYINFPFTPNHIKVELANAMGFDFYQPKQRMILRFDRFYSEKYIDESFRHETFHKIHTPEEIERWYVKKILSSGERKAIVQILTQWRAMNAEEPTHSYFWADYRVNDNNVIMRLRAWGDKVEVLYPPPLRQRMADDSKKMATLYQDSE